MSRKSKKFSAPCVSAIIERRHRGQTEILIQTRWKPGADPKYSGTIEIPAGLIEAFQPVDSILRKEVYEETGLRVTRIFPTFKTKTYSPRRDGAYAFTPLCCQQQIRGGKPWIGFVFVCRVANGRPKPQKSETRDVRWINKSELKKIFLKTPEKIFTLQLGALDYYFNHYHP